MFERFLKDVKSTLEQMTTQLEQGIAADDTTRLPFLKLHLRWARGYLYAISRAAYLLLDLGYTDECDRLLEELGAFDTRLGEVEQDLYRLEDAL